MGGRRDYSRWDYDDETEITMEEQLTLEDNSNCGSAEALSTATFPPPNILASNSPIRSRLRDSCNRSRKTSMKEKSTILLCCTGVLLVGFMAGFGIGVRNSDRETPTASSRHSKHVSSMSDPMSTSSHEHNDLIFHELLQQISAHNIYNNLKTMTKKEHRAGTQEGHSMAKAILDLWRTFGISVHIEQHKTLLTKSESFNYVEGIGDNGNILFTTKVEDDINLPNSHPIMAFSPPSDLNGTLVFGNYGRLEDFQLLQKSQLTLGGSNAICIMRFGTLHPSSVALNAAGFGCKGLIFYPDPHDFGPRLPTTAVRSSTLLTVGQVHDYQKRKGNWSIPSHTISAKDAEKLFKAMEGTEKAPMEWEGGLNVNYYIGGRRKPGLVVRLRVFNSAKTSSIYNVVAAIPGYIESDRYIIIGCSHDSLAGSGAGDPGVGLALTTELLKAFSASLAEGWRPRRSILFISFDANLFASSGVSHWLQEHHFEIGTRAVTYIDLTRILKGNQTLEVFSSPLLKEVARKAINKIKHASSAATLQQTEKMPQGLENVQWKSVVSSDEASFAFIGNLGVPFIRLCFSNAPKDYNYPLFHTQFDTLENFVNFVDPNLKGAETLGRIIAEIMILLADKSLMDITLHDYVKEIRKEFDHFMAEYHDDFHKANLSYAQFQAAFTRLEVTADNFRNYKSRNHTKGDGSHHHKLRQEIQHRILNDKLISVEKAFLRNADAYDGYKHQLLGHTSSDMAPEIPLQTRKTGTPVESKSVESHLVNKSSSVVIHTTTNKGKNNNFHSRRVFSTEHSSRDVPHFFPKLRAVLECGRSCEAGLNNGGACTDPYLFTTISQPGSETDESIKNNTATHVASSCLDWRSVAAQRLSSLVRSFDAVSAIIQSPLVAQPHE